MIAGCYLRSANGGRVLLAEIRVIFPVCNATKMVYISLSPPLIFLPFPHRLLSSSSSSSLSSLALHLWVPVVLFLAPRVFRVRLCRAVNGEQKALGAHAPALSFSLSLFLSFPLDFPLVLFLVPCPPRIPYLRKRHREISGPAVCLSLLRFTDPPRIVLPFQRRHGDDQRDRCNQTTERVSSPPWGSRARPRERLSRGKLKECS